MPTKINKNFTITSIFMFIVITNGLELHTDLAHGASFSDIFITVSVLLLSALLILWILYDQNKKVSELKQLIYAIENREVNQHSMSDDLRDVRIKLSKVISCQLDDWLLTASEKEVAWLLLKGLSMEEISAIRATHEKLVRQQSSRIYKKSGLNDRHAFSSWFIEDLA